MASPVKGILRTALSPIFGDRVFPSVAPAGTARPYGTFQRVGGADSFTNDGISTTRNARVQVNVWSDTAQEADDLMEQVMAALCGDTVNAAPIGEAVDVHEEDTKLYGSRLDFSIWYSTT